MRPKKNIVFCHASQKPKMLFKSQSKADNFIKFNSEEILKEKGKAPVRSYFCQMCGGYHLTSNRSLRIGEMCDERDKTRLDNLKQTNVIVYDESKEVQAIMQTFYQRLVLAEHQLTFGMIKESEELFDICHLDLEQLKDYSVKRRDRVAKMSKKLEEIEEYADIIKSMLDLTEEEQQAFLAIEDPDEEQYRLKVIVKNNNALKRTNEVLTQNEQLLDDEEIEKVKEGIVECEQCLSTIIGKGRKKVKAFYNIWINDQKKKIKDIRLKKEESFDHIYKSTILSLIERLESIKSAYDNQDYEECSDLIDIGLFILDHDCIKDDKTDLLRSQFDFWAKELNSKRIRG